MENHAVHFDKLKNQKILLAHSGGVDSSVLAYLLVQEKLNFSVAHCNFQLRGAESDSDFQFVRKWCLENEIPFYSKTFDTEAFKKENKIGTQEAARELRYNWFFSLMENESFDVILTGHHLNDQLETFLINTIRGTGLPGLLGISSSKPLCRPLLEFTKKEILEFAKENKIQWREDQTNSEAEYLRNHLRKNVIPPLVNARDHVLNNFKTTLSQLNETEEFIVEQMELLRKKIFKIERGVTVLLIAELKKIKSLHFCLHRWLAPLGFDAKEVEKLIDAQSGKFLVTSSHRLIRDREKLLLSILLPSDQEEIPIDIDKGEMSLPLGIDWKIVSSEEVETFRPNEAYLDKDLLKNPLYLRKFRKGDYFYPTGMKGKKLLSKFFKDEKYSLLDKEQQWLLTSGKDIVWVVGKRCDRRFIVQSNSKIKLLMWTGK